MIVSIQENTDFSRRIGNSKLQKLGRFRWYRHLVSQYKKQSQKLIQGRLVNLDTQVYTQKIDIPSAIAQIREQAVYCGLNLHSHLVEEILEFAKSQKCVDPKQKTGTSFYFRELDQVDTSNKIYRGLITNTQKCRAINAIAYNPISLALASNFLGYTPTKITTHLTWSFPTSPADTDVYQQYAPTNWHYDVVGEESLTLNFYITDVSDSESGPHEYIEKTHGKHTPWQLLFSGNIIDQKLIEKYFWKRPLVSLLGHAGFGFAEDPTCIHRVKPPTSQSRLILQIRYS